jgi:hypothetical protein
MNRLRQVDRTARRQGRMASSIFWPVGKFRQNGQSSMEYVVVCAALAFALGIGMVDDNSVLWQLLEAFRTAYAKISFSVSLPS